MIDREDCVNALARIIVHVDDTDDCPNRLRLAAIIARRLGASLTALHVTLRAADPFAMPCIPDCSRIEETARGIRTTLRHAEEHFHKLSHDMPSARWRVVDAEPSLFDDVAPTLLREARFADLSIVGQASDGKPGDHRVGAVPQELLLRSGRPVLVVPRDCAAVAAIDRMMVCWKADRESARAVRDALPLLRQATAVRLVQVGEPGEDGDDATRTTLELETLADYLAAHGIAATIQRDDNAAGQPVGTRLLQQAAAYGADLVVMGGYNHSRLHEYLLGGVTRHILTETTLPVFLSH